MRSSLLPNLATLVLLVSSGGMAVAVDSAWHWEAFGPAGNTDGLVAIEVDRTRADRFWLAGSSAVWVTDDGGDTFSLVFEAPRHRGSTRTSHALDDDEDLVRDFDSFNPMDFDAADSVSREPWIDEVVDGWDQALDAPDEDTSDEADDADLVEAATTEEVSEDRLNPFVRGRFGITRLRASGGHLWICTSRGLWRVPRDARRLGTATEVKLGRSVGVNDFAMIGPKLAVVATDAGLWTIGGGPRGLTTRVRGIEFDTTVTAVAVTGTHIFAATSLGLYRATRPGDVFTRLGGGRRSRAGLVDVLATTAGVWSTDGSQVFAYDSAGSRLRSVSQVPGAQRLFDNGGGALWAVGEQGPWVESSDGWVRVDGALPDRRLRDGAAGCGPSGCGGGGGSTVMVVGIQGAWRSARGGLGPLAGAEAEATLEWALARRPSLATLIAHMESQRGLSLGRIEAFATRERLSWLVPRLEVSVRAGVMRDTQRPFIPALGRRILEAVAVTPAQAEVQVMAYWDLMPAILASLDASQSRVYEASRVVARQSQRRLRETLPPLWRRWAAEQRQLWRAPPATPRAAIRAVLQVAQLEAQLHALTAGEFPITKEPTAYFSPKD